MKRGNEMWMIMIIIIALIAIIVFGFLIQSWMSQGSALTQKALF